MILVVSFRCLYLSLKAASAAPAGGREDTTQERVECGCSICPLVITVKDLGARGSESIDMELL
jgi:hypothetical protein